MTKTKYATGTKTDLYNRLIALVEKSNDQYKNEIVERLNHEINLISKKSAVKPEVEELNNKIRNAILDTLNAKGKAMTVGEIQDSHPELARNVLTTSKVSGVVTKMWNEGVVTRTTEKGKNYYAIQG